MRCGSHYCPRDGTQQAAALHFPLTSGSIPGSLSVLLCPRHLPVSLPWDRMLSRVRNLPGIIIAFHWGITRQNRDVCKREEGR